MFPGAANSEIGGTEQEISNIKQAINPEHRRVSWSVNRGAL